MDKIAVRIAILEDEVENSYSIAEARDHLAAIVHEVEESSAVEFLVLVTSNVSDYAGFEGLRIEDWRTA